MRRLLLSLVQRKEPSFERELLFIHLGLLILEAMSLYGKGVEATRHGSALKTLIKYIEWPRYRLGAVIYRQRFPTSCRADAQDPDSPLGATVEIGRKRSFIHRVCDSHLLWVHPSITFPVRRVDARSTCHAASNQPRLTLNPQPNALACGPHFQRSPVKPRCRGHEGR